MPLLIYGANIPVDEDFKIEMFLDDKIVDPASWEEFMPSGITKKIFQDFIKYYDPEIFIGAGHRIRNLAKSADELKPTERVKKLAEIFSTFKNPDKETVLTPFRVVNIHMSDCLGGWDFFDERHENILDAPRYVETKIFNADAKILEINSKTGLYPPAFTEKNSATGTKILCRLPNFKKSGTKLSAKIFLSSAKRRWRRQSLNELWQVSEKSR